MRHLESLRIVIYIWRVIKFFIRIRIRIRIRHDVILFCRGWSDLDKNSQTGAEWHVDCGDVVEIETKCRIPIWRLADVWANSMACHPRATYHVGGCCHLVNSLSCSQSHMPHYRVQSSGEINVTIVPHCRVQEFHPPYWKSFSPYFFVFLKCSLGFDERRLSYRLRYTCCKKLLDFCIS